MGVNLTPIVVKRVVTVEGLRDRSLAVDANNALYQFLSLIRTPDGTHLRDSYSSQSQGTVRKTVRT